MQGPGAQALARALRKQCGLHTLRLAEARLGNAGALQLASGLRRNGTLQRLQLSQNSIGAHGSAAILERAATESSDTPIACALTHLNLSHNPVGDAGMLAMQESLRDCSAMRELVLQSCSIGNQGVQIGC